jgi:transcriptional regulator with XRE-family HTH domain
MSTRSIETRQTSGFPARLRETLARFGSAQALALAIQRSESAVRKWLRGRSEPSVTDLRAICEVTQTRIDWLVTGRGAPEEPAVLREPSPPYGEAARPPLDLALLESVVGAVEAELRQSAITLPAFKHATLIAACYDLARAEGGPDPRVIARLVKLAG